MKASASLLSGEFKSVINNGRGHEIITDLPVDMDGTDEGAMALEVCIMSLAGCITTIFSMIAQKSRVEFSKVDVDIDATKGKTIEKAVVDVKVKSTAPTEKIQKVLDKTLAMCPVGIIFDQAGIEVGHSLTVE